MARKTRTEREKLSDHCKILTKLLLHEASGGIIPLPRGAEGYVPPPIPFTERRALLDSASKGLLIDMKVNPDSQESGFDILKDELNERNRKRASGEDGDRGISPSANGALDPDADITTDGDTIFAGGSVEH